MQHVPLSIITWFTILFALGGCGVTVPYLHQDAKPAVVVVDKSQPPVPVVANEKPPVAAASATPKPVEQSVETAVLNQAEKVTSSPLVEESVKPLPPVQLNEDAEPHIALLLPFKSAIFRSAAEAVLNGFQTAANIASPEREEGSTNALPVRVYFCQDESKEIVDLYQQAIADGARAVAGPLTRNGAGALAAWPDIHVPTLALNVTDSPVTGPLYFFGLAAETEARQVAQLARQEGFQRIIMITSQVPLAKRLQLAFESEWNALGGKIQKTIEFNGDPAVFANIDVPPDTALFFAVDVKKAQLIRSYLPNKLPIYATSQLFLGNESALTNFDLNGIRFIDMPWLLQPDHPAVMIYPRTSPPLAADYERLYALGIDAFRLIQLIQDNTLNEHLPLDGVSGQIQLKGHTFQRTSIPAVFSMGRAQLIGSSGAAPVQQFPDQPVSQP